MFALMNAIATLTIGMSSVGPFGYSAVSHTPPTPKPAPVTAPAEPAQPAPQPPPPAPAPTPQPNVFFTMYDAVTEEAIPAGKPVAGYSNGNYVSDPGAYKSPVDIKWIDVTGENHNAQVLDLEPGNGGPSMAAGWVAERIAEHPDDIAIIYTMKSWWEPVKQSINTLPLDVQDHVRYWIADPTGVEHMLPGASATQWYWGQDLDKSLVKDGWAK